jgi:hypothetical protein
MPVWPHRKHFTHSYFPSSNLKTSMTIQQQEMRRTAPNNIQVVTPSSSLSITEPLSTRLTGADGSMLNEPFRPFTTLIIAVITDAAQLQQYASVPALAQPLGISPNVSKTSLHSSAPTTSYLRSSTSSRQWHITQVGTVVAESEIPDAWSPNSLGKERVRQARFLGYVGLVCVVTMIGIIGIGWLREARRFGWSI